MLDPPTLRTKFFFKIEHAFYIIGGCVTTLPVITNNNQKNIPISIAPTVDRKEAYQPSVYHTQYSRVIWNWSDVIDR